MTEQEKRDLGLWYDANYDPSILQEREHADMLCFQLNNTPPNQTQKRQELLRTLITGTTARLERIPFSITAHI